MGGLFPLRLALLFLLQLFTEQPYTIRIGGRHRVFVTKIKVKSKPLFILPLMNGRYPALAKKRNIPVENLIRD